MKAKSVAETGAKFGDYVICVGAVDEMPARFRVGERYKVVNFNGRPSVRGHTDFRKPDGTGRDIPWLGYGALWERA